MAESVQDGARSVTMTPEPDKEPSASSDRSMVGQSHASFEHRLEVQNPAGARSDAAAAASKTSCASDPSNKGKTPCSSKSSNATATKKKKLARVPTSSSQSGSSMAPSSAVAAGAATAKTNSSATPAAHPSTASSANPLASGGIGPIGVTLLVGELRELRTSVSDGFHNVSDSLHNVSDSLHSIESRIQQAETRFDPMTDVLQSIDTSLQVARKDWKDTADATYVVEEDMETSAKDIHSTLEFLQQMDLPQAVGQACAPVLQIAERLGDACQEANSAAHFMQGFADELIMSWQGPDEESILRNRPAPVYRRRAVTPVGPSSSATAPATGQRRTFSERDSPEPEHHSPHAAPQLPLERASWDGAPALLARMGEVRQRPEYHSTQRGLYSRGWPRSRGFGRRGGSQ